MILIAIILFILCIHVLIFQYFQDLTFLFFFFHFSLANLKKKKKQFESSSSISLFSFIEKKVKSINV